MEIEKAFKRLLIKNPFYGLFCLSLPKEVTRKIPTLCISREGINCKLNINPDFWEQHTDDEQLAMLQHELSHICLQHMFMCESFKDHQLFNIAADAEVNSYIDNLPSNAVTAASLQADYGIPFKDGMGTKKYYELLSQNQQQQAGNPQKPCNGGQGGQAPSSSSPSQAASNDTSDNSNSQEPTTWQQEKEQKEDEHQYPETFSNRYKPVDDHSSWKSFENLPEATRQLMENNVNTILKQTAEQVEKSRGTIPGELVDIIEKLKEKRPEVFNWKAYFRRLLGSIYDVNIRSTRRKESKRFEGAAGIQHKKKVSILVAVDTSGSVSSEELQEFFAEIDYVYKAGARITLIECDAQINKIVEYDGKNIPEINGRGGTDFLPPINYYKDHKREYASLIYFTDGESYVPETVPSNVVWVITPDGCHQDYPGKVIYIPKSNS